MEVLPIRSHTIWPQRIDVCSFIEFIPPACSGDIYKGVPVTLPYRLDRLRWGWSPYFEVLYWLSLRYPSPKPEPLQNFQSSIGFRSRAAHHDCGQMQWYRQLWNIVITSYRLGALSFMEVKSHHKVLDLESLHCEVVATIIENTNIVNRTMLGCGSWALTLASSMKRLSPSEDFARLFVRFSLRQNDSNIDLALSRPSHTPFPSRQMCSYRSSVKKDSFFRCALDEVPVVSNVCVSCGRASVFWS